MSIPRRIAVDGADLRLECPMGSITVPIAEVRKVDARAWNRGFVIVTAEHRKIYMLRSTKNLFAISPKPPKLVREPCVPGPLGRAVAIRPGGAAGPGFSRAGAGELVSSSNARTRATSSRPQRGRPGRISRRPGDRRDQHHRFARHAVDTGRGGPRRRDEIRSAASGLTLVTTPSPTRSASFRSGPLRSPSGWGRSR